MGHCTLDQLKQWLADNPAELDAYDDTLAELIEAATAQIFFDTGRVFQEPAADEQRVLVSDDGYVYVTDLSATSGTITVRADSGWWDGGGTLAVEGVDYELGPKVPPYGQARLRYDWVRPLPTSSLDWSYGTQVRVTGKFGYVNRQGVVPYCIRRACVLHAARLWERRRLMQAGKQDAATGHYEHLHENDPDYWRLVRPFVHPRRLGPA